MTVRGSRAFIESLKRIRASDVEWLLPSHGPIFRRDDALLEGAIKRLDAVERTVHMGSDDYWCHIPAGTFLMGAQSGKRTNPNHDKDAQEDESPVHEVELGSYRIAQNPVTVGDYRRFVEDRGYEKEDCWTAGGFQHHQRPKNWKEQLKYPNRPVTGVSWYEAAAFAAWADVRLPTEAEWEHAARGPEGRRYPWGNETPDASRANYVGQIGNATQVGVYPRGATPEGVLDMAGNVWEWCADVGHDDYEGAPSDGSAWTSGGDEDPRVLRGGSYDNIGRHFRSSSRYRDGPVSRHNSVGFRISAGT